jgi:serine/threonine-protein kinase
MRRAFIACALAAAFAAPATAKAQSKDDIARADALFNAAKALTDAGQFADACAKFAESKRLAPGIGVTLYLADCYEHIGRTASAWTEFRSAEGLARERSDKRADVARAHAEALEPKLDRLTITVAPTIPQAGLQVLRDGVAVTTEELGLPSPVDPGDHAVVVSAPGHAARTFNAHVGPEAPSATVHIDSLDEPTAAPVPVPVPIPVPPPPTPVPTPLPVIPETPPPAADTGATRRVIGLGVGALGVIGIGIGSAFGIIAKSRFDQTNVSQCNATDHCTTPGLAGRQDAEHAATASNLGFTIGAVLLAGGAALYFTATKHSARTGVVVAPAPMVGGGGALLRATF